VAVRFECWSVRHALRQAVSEQGGKLDFGHVEPRAVLGREDEFDPLPERVSPRRLKSLLEGRRLVGR
jgi:hypothetical protein